MRVFVTGSIGFVGGWLEKDLRAAGHEVVGAPDPEALDIADWQGLARWLGGPSGPPEAVVHLAGMAFAPDADQDPSEAFRVNVGGTVALFEALRRLDIRPPVLVSCSADVYGNPRPEDLPLTEDAPIAPKSPYGLSKAAQEGVAVEASLLHGFPVVVARSFNHAGPGQRPVFVVPAMARRVVAVTRGEATTIPAGNVDVRRDFTDVRDVVRGYRLLVEAIATGSLPAPCTVVNIASERAVSARSVIERLAAMAGIEPVIEVQPDLFRPEAPGEVRGDAGLVRRLVGWEPAIPLDQTLADVLAEAQAEPARTV
jgi:GDP-4-dehydro-6-deoxy-D-mannose reductase